LANGGCTGGKGETAINAEELLKRCWDAAGERKAEDLAALDLGGLSSVADYFLICSGTSEPHLKAIRDHLEREARTWGRRPRTVEGFPESLWIVIDFGDVLVHLFHPRTREYYGLEELWSDGKRWRPDAAGGGSAATPASRGDSTADCG
jgi:ribosome-associated protein